MLLGLFVPGQKLITMALFCFIAMPWWLSSQCSSWQCRRFRWRTQTDLVADNDRKLLYFFFWETGRKRFLSDLCSCISLRIEVVLMGALFVTGGALQVRVWPWRTEQAHRHFQKERSRNTQEINPSLHWTEFDRTSLLRIRIPVWIWLERERE